MDEKIIRKDFPKTTPETELSKIVNIFSNGVEAIPVFKDKKYAGMISINNITKRDYPAKTKVKKLMRKNIPKANKKMDFIELCKLVLKNDIKALPVFENEEFLGLIYEKDLIRNSEKYLSKTNKNMEDIIAVPETIKKDKKIGKVRKVLREKNISRIPVVDEEERLVGIIDTVDFLKTINPEESLGREDFSGENLPEKELSITTIMDPSPTIIRRSASWKEVIKKMEDKDKSYVLITKEDKPVGIVTPKDILEIIISLEEVEGVYVQITGLKKVENFFDREKIDKMIKNFIQKIGKIYKEIEYMFVHIKTYQESGKDKRYSIRTRILIPLGLYVSKSSEWNAIASVNEALNKLEKQILKDHEKHKDRKKPRNP